MQTPPEHAQSAPAPAAPKPKSVAWADMVDGMDTMPVAQARRLTPSDINVGFGPIMDEREFEAYRKARGNKVRVVTAKK